MSTITEGRIDLFGISANDLTKLFLECIQHEARSSSPIDALRIREDMRGAIIARCEGKVPPFRIGSRVRPRKVPLFPQSGTNATALYSTAIRIVADVGYDSQQKIWWIELKDSEYDGPAPRFWAQDFERVITHDL